jgi:hypothetical protein
MKVFRKKIVWITLVGLTLFACSIVANAQSGRRKIDPPPAAPIPTPTPEPTPTSRDEQQEPEIIFLVGADQNRSYESYPISFYDAVVRGCADVLRNSSAAVDASNRDLPRGEAIKKAKKSPKTYVVVLELKTDAMGGAPSNTNFDKIELEYVVFTPLTAKVATSGRTYPNATRKGPLVVGPPTSRGAPAIYRETLLQRAGEEAGERILKALHLSIPRTH